MRETGKIRNTDDEWYRHSVEVARAAQHEYFGRRASSDAEEGRKELCRWAIECAIKAGAPVGEVVAVAETFENYVLGMAEKGRAVPEDEARNG